MLLRQALLSPTVRDSRTKAAHMDASEPSGRLLGAPAPMSTSLCQLIQFHAHMHVVVQTHMQLCK